MFVIATLCLLLITAHLLGRLAVRFGQTALLGHMMAGVLLGPAMLGWVSANATLNTVSDICLLFVIADAGLEMRLRDISSLFNRRHFLGLLPGIVLPAISGYAIAYHFGLSPHAATAVSLCVAVTALPVALRILTSFGLLDTPLARLTIASALLADVVILLCLGLLTNHEPVSAQACLIGLIKIAALILVVLMARWLCQRVAAFQSSRHNVISKKTWPMALVLIPGLAVISSALGLHFAIGAFLGALVVGDMDQDDVATQASNAQPVNSGLQTLSNQLFAPLFLATQGTHLIAGTLFEPGFALLLILGAVLSKLIGGYAGARMLRFSHHDAIGVGIVMNARGVMEMVVANIAWRAGLVDQEIFAALLLVGMVTTLLTSMLLKGWQRYSPRIP